MDASNANASQGSETRADFVENVGSCSVGESAEQSDCTSNLVDNGSNINECETNTGSSDATEINTAQDSISETVSGDLAGRNTETPVPSEHSEHSVDTIQKQSSNETINKTPPENPPKSNSTEILDLPQDVINTEPETSQIDDTINNHKIVEPSDTNTINNQNDSQASSSNDTITNQHNERDFADSNNSPYYIKWITWKGLKTAIVTQNDNGPCPLLAIINILLLRRMIAFPSMQEMVTTRQLMEYLGDVVLKAVPENMAGGVLRNFEQNMQDAINILPKLTTGLDVNVKFTGVGDFEFTPECIIFDLLSIKLYHGWLVDPQSAEYKAAIANLSYNQLVEKIVASKETDCDSQLSSEGLFAESFLEETANQLTCHGVCELNATLNEDELCVFFRNNHFSTLYKHQGELFILLTDQGFLTEDKMVWQTLSSVYGDGIFVDCNFKSVLMPNEPVSGKPPLSSALSQEDQDYMLALSIQNEQQQQAQQQSSPQEQQHSDPQPVIPPQPLPQEPQEDRSNNGGMSEQELFDLQYAMQLQEEEEARARTGQPQRQQRQQQQQQPQRRGGRRQTPPPSDPHFPRNVQQRQTGGNCLIL